MDIKNLINRKGGIQGCRAITIFFLGCLLGWGNGQCATYYVSPNGSDANPGTIDLPLKTLVKVAAKVQAGDQVLIDEGVYSERLNITRSGTADAPIVFQAKPGATPVIDATGLSQGVIIWNASYIVIQGLTVKNSLRSGIHIHDHLDEHGADHNRIEGNMIEQCGSQGYNGIYVGGHYNHVIDNRLANNGQKANNPNHSGHGIYVFGNYNMVSRNTVHGSGRVGIRLEGENNVFKKNKIEDSSDFGITIWVDDFLKGENIVIQNNTVRNNQRGGISVYGQGNGQKPENILISGNTIDNQTAEYGIRIMEGCSRVRIIGNTITGQYQTAVLYVDEASLLGFEESRNSFECSGTFFYKNQFYETYADFKQASLTAPDNIRRAQ